MEKEARVLSGEIVNEISEGFLAYKNRISFFFWANPEIDKNKNRLRIIDFII
jgi:hypothetical protein